MTQYTEKSEFAPLLRAAKLKATPSRTALLSCLQKTRRPLSAAEIIGEFRKKIDPATVYRILRAFASKGIVCHVDLRHNHAHYELAQQKEHHHLTCEKCGRIEDVRECGVGEMHEMVLRKTRGFSEIRQHALEFYGICRSCGKRENASEHKEIKYLKARKRKQTEEKTFGA